VTETHRTGTLAALAALAWIVLVWRHVDDDTAPMPPAPSHIGTDVAVCSVSHAPARHAHHLEHRAEAQMSRYPFRAAEGLTATAALSEAAACFAAADAPADTARLRRRHAVWRARIDRDYRDGRLRLARALRDQDDARTRDEAARLHALVGGGRGPYARWLRALALDTPAPEGPTP